MRGLGKDRPTVAERTDKTFEEATATVVPAARSLLSRLRATDDPAAEISIEFGVQLSAQTGAFIASAAVEANFKVSMTWRHGPGDLRGAGRAQAAGFRSSRRTSR